MTSKFTSLMAGLRYRVACPLCGSAMQLDDKDLIETSVVEGYPIFSFRLDMDNWDTISIDSYTENIVVTIHRPKEIVSGATSLRGMSSISSTPNYNNGWFYFGLSIKCEECCQYYYTLQFCVDLTAKKLEGTYLNSETVSLEEGIYVHEIKNYYSSKKTRYTKFTDNVDGSDKIIEIPLVPLDLEEPTKTLARIKRLTIFS